MSFLFVYEYDFYSRETSIVVNMANGENNIWNKIWKLNKKRNLSSCTKFVFTATKIDRQSVTSWKESKYGVFSGPYFPVLSPNTGKYGPEKTLYLDIFHAVHLTNRQVFSDSLKGYRNRTLAWRRLITHKIHFLCFFILTEKNTFSIKL